ncbi:Thymidylate kinase [compost metagenome]
MVRATGLFVAVDGPKGAGKTTILRHVQLQLQVRGVSVLLTKEPTLNFKLKNEENHTGIGLVRLLVDDRAYHLDEEILPGLASYDVVLTDRYIASSVGFGVLDGVSFEDAWRLNQTFRLPDLNIFLTADESSIARRRSARVQQTRIEKKSNLYEEIELYRRIDHFLEGRGVVTKTVDNSDSHPEGLAAKAIVDIIEGEYNHRNAQ